jgi:hypothetical protein
MYTKFFAHLSLVLFNIDIFFDVDIDIDIDNFFNLYLTLNLVHRHRVKCFSFLILN